MLTISIENTDYHTGDNIILTKQQCLVLELKLNVSCHGIEWRHIGDYLYNYKNGKYPNDYEIMVSLEQFIFLQLLITKNNWIECKNLR